MQIAFVPGRASIVAPLRCSPARITCMPRSFKQMIISSWDDSKLVPVELSDSIDLKVDTRDDVSSQTPARQFAVHDLVFIHSRSSDVKGDTRAARSILTLHWGVGTCPGNMAGNLLKVEAAPHSSCGEGNSVGSSEGASTPSGFMGVCGCLALPDWSSTYLPSNPMFIMPIGSSSNVIVLLETIPLFQLGLDMKDFASANVRPPASFVAVTVALA
mmetsp:Transcript_28539/g.54967  ORF Transcript_28539/g.54967 Transcript_28539/m.54967 type:complete len:215 (-) Transcript_28539:53-697(-)